MRSLRGLCDNARYAMQRTQTLPTLLGMRPPAVLTRARPHEQRAERCTRTAAQVSVRAQRVRARAADRATTTRRRSMPWCDRTIHSLPPTRAAERDATRAMHTHAVKCIARAHAGVGKHLLAAAVAARGGGGKSSRSHMQREHALSSRCTPHKMYCWPSRSRARPSARRRRRQHVRAHVRRWQRHGRNSRVRPRVWAVRFAGMTATRW